MTMVAGMTNREVQRVEPRLSVPATQAQLTIFDIGFFRNRNISPKADSTDLPYIHNCPEAARTGGP
jgi:hypothetical protein